MLWWNRPTEILKSTAIVLTLLATGGAVLLALNSPGVEHRREMALYRSIVPGMTVEQVESRLGIPGLVESPKSAADEFAEMRTYDTYRKSKHGFFDFETYITVYFDARGEVLKTLIDD